MKLERKFDRFLTWMVLTTIVLIASCFVKFGAGTTSAGGEEREDTVFATEGAKFVTFYDDGNKLTVKTEAGTVEEALKRAGIKLSTGDKVEPELATEITVDNFFINVYRARPVVVRDGAKEKYLMTASSSYREIAKEAGITVYDGDEINLMRNDRFLENGAANVYEISRRGGQTLTVEEEIPFVEEKVKDYNLEAGVSEVRQMGEVGTKRAIYNILYVDGVEISRELVSETVVREPVKRIVAEGVSWHEKHPLTARQGANYYTIEAHGEIVERKETYYDLPMSRVMRNCGKTDYVVREDGVKVDDEGYVLVAADLGVYPRCSVVETSLGPGKVYDTGTFALSNSEQFDLATDWTNQDGR